MGVKMTGLGSMKIGGSRMTKQRLHVADSRMQSPQHALYPLLQAMPQVVPLHVDVPLAGTAQGSQRLPQVAVLTSEAQLLPQRW
jgi:hypothetical protein